jgi:hypothetical protein
MYAVSLSGATDLAGNAMAPMSWAFTTGAPSDTTAPTITARTPAVDATNVAVNTTASATFSEDVAPSSAQIMLTRNGTPVAATVSYNAGTRVLTLTPSAALQFSTTYVVNVSGATDAGGNVMTPVTWTFTTAPAPDTTAPTVTARTPGVNAVNVAANTTPTATFSEAVTPTSIQFTLTPQGGSAVAATAAYNATTRVITLTPAAPLAYNTVYTARVAGASDAAGNVMAPVSWNFTTTSGPLYFSTLGNDPPGVSGTDDDADIYGWSGTAFSRLWDATQNGISSATNVDGYDRLDATRFYLSFSSDASVPGLGTVQDEDIVFFNGSSWSVFFDGTARGLTDANEDIDAFSIVGGTIYFSTTGNTNPPNVGGTADDADIYRWNGSSFARVWDASQNGLGSSANVDGLVVLDATHLYLSFTSSVSLSGVGTATDVDVAYFNAGSWSIYFDGDGRGLSSGTNDDIDAFDIG